MLVVASCIISKDMAWPSWELRKIDNHFVSSPSFTKLNFQNILYGLLHDSPLGSPTLNRDRAKGRITSDDKMLYHSKNKSVVLSTFSSHSSWFSFPDSNTTCWQFLKPCSSSRSSYQTANILFSVFDVLVKWSVTYYLGDRKSVKYKVISFFTAGWMKWHSCVFLCGTSPYLLTQYGEIVCFKHTLDYPWKELAFCAVSEWDLYRRVILKRAPLSVFGEMTPSICTGLCSQYFSCTIEALPCCGILF